MIEGRRKDLSALHVVRGSLVSLGGSIGARLLGFAAMAALARLLLPEDFGVFATAMIFIGLCRALMNRQFHLALVRLPEIERSHFDTAFTMSLIWGLLAGGTLFAGADLLAGVMNTPAVAPALRLMSLALMIEGFYSPAFVRYERNLDLRPEVVLEWTGKILQYAVSISLAVLWQSYWALVLGFLAFTVVRVILSHVFAPWPPRLDLTHARAFLSFGGWLSGTGLAGYAIGFTDVTLVAARLGTASVGFYNLAAEVVRMASDYLAMPLGRTVYPGLSAVIHDPVRLRQAFLDAVEVLLGLMLPIGVGLALVAPEAIPLLLGRQWTEAAPVVSVLAPAAAISTVSYAAQSIVMAEGRTRAMFVRNVVVAVVQLPLILLGIVWGGLVGAAAGRAMGMMLHGVLSLLIAAPMAGVPAGRLLLISWRSLAASAVMALAVIWLHGITSGWAGADELTGRFLLTALVAKVAFGATVYLSVHATLWFLAGRPRGLEQFLVTRLLPALRRT